MPATRGATLSGRARRSESAGLLTSHLPLALFLVGVGLVFYRSPLSIFVLPPTVHLRRSDHSIRLQGPALSVLVIKSRAFRDREDETRALVLGFWRPRENDCSVVSPVVSMLSALRTISWPEADKVDEQTEGASRRDENHSLLLTTPRAKHTQPGRSRQILEQDCRARATALSAPAAIRRPRLRPAHERFYALARPRRPFETTS